MNSDEKSSYLHIIISIIYDMIYIVYECFACIYACALYVCSTLGGQKKLSDTVELELPVTDPCELPSVFWELDQGPLQEKLVLLTAVPPMIYIFFNSS